jgi:hypothetical protein
VRITFTQTATGFDANYEANPSSGTINPTRTTASSLNGTDISWTTIDDPSGIDVLKSDFTGTLTLNTPIDAYSMQGSVTSSDFLVQTPAGTGFSDLIKYDATFTAAQAPGGSTAIPLPPAVWTGLLGLSLSLSASPLAAVKRKLFAERR